MSVKAIGLLTVDILDASPSVTYVENWHWEDNLREAFVKVEIRGGSRKHVTNASRKSTAVKSLNQGKITWKEPITLTLYEGDEELRVIICRNRVVGSRSANSVEGATVVAGCAVYLKEIISGAPIAKELELYRPKHTLWGTLQVALNFRTSDEQTKRHWGLSLQEGSTKDKHIPSRGFVRRLSLMGFLALGVLACGRLRCGLWLCGTRRICVPFLN